MDIVKILSRFAACPGKKTPQTQKDFMYKVFCNDGKIFSTDGKIFAYSDHDCADFYFYEVDGKIPKLFNSASPGKHYETIREEFDSGRRLSRIIETMVDTDFEFTIDFSDVPLPVKLLSGKAEKYMDIMTLDFEKNDVRIDFNGGVENDNVTANYGDILTDVSELAEVQKLTEEFRLSARHVFEIMRVTKEKTLRIRCNLDRKYCLCDVSSLHFIFMRLNG